MGCEFSPAWVSVVLYILTLVFLAGGIVAAFKLKSSNSEKCHAELERKLEHLDDVKQSKSVCAERHTTIEVSLLALSQNVADIKEDIRWFKSVSGGGE